MNPKVVVVVVLLVALCFGAGTEAQERGRGNGRRNQGNETTTEAPGRGREPGERGRGLGLPRGPEVAANLTAGNETTTEQPGRGRGEGHGQREGRRRGQSEQSNGQPGGFGQRPPNGRLPETPLSDWKRVINGTEFAERGFAILNRSMVEFIAADPLLENQTAYIPCIIVLYENTTNTTQLVIRPLSTFQVCFIVAADALVLPTIQQASDTIYSRNNTVVSDPLVPVLLNATEGPIEAAERAALFDTNPLLIRFCGNRLIVRAEKTNDGETVGPDARTASFVGLVNEINVIVPATAKKPRPHDVTTPLPGK